MSTQQTQANRKHILAREAAIARQIAAHFAALQRAIRAAQAALIAAYAAEQQRLYDDAVAQAEADDEDPDEVTPPPVPVTWLTQSGQWHRYERVLLPAMASFALYSRMQITDGQRLAARSGVSDGRSLLGTALSRLLGKPIGDGLLRAPDGTQLAAMLGRSSYSGKSLAALLDGIGPHTAERTLKALRAALLSGASPEMAARLIADTTGMAYSRALTVSRTEMMAAYRTAQSDTFQANSDVLSGWMWVAAPDACPFCASMNGTIHDLSELLDAHPNCRCQMQPILKPLSALGTFLSGFLGGLAAGVLTGLLDNEE